MNRRDPENRIVTTPIKKTTQRSVGYALELLCNSPKRTAWTRPCGRKAWPGYSCQSHFARNEDLRVFLLAISVSFYAHVIEHRVVIRVCSRGTASPCSKCCLRWRELNRTCWCGTKTSSVATSPCVLFQFHPGHALCSKIRITWHVLCSLPPRTLTDVVSVAAAVARRRSMMWRTGGVTTTNNTSHARD